MTLTIPSSLSHCIGLKLVLRCGFCAALLFALIHAAGNVSAQPSQTTPPLEIGKPIERELTGGQSHAYRITLAAGQYLNLVVEQRGIDVVVTLFAPDGKQLLEEDINGEQGPEPLAWIATLSGVHRLEVRPLEKDAKAGRYEAKLIEVRRATVDDRAQIEKMRALQEAVSLNNEVVRLYQAGKYDEAIPLALRTLAIREKALGPEHPDTAQSLNNLALLYDSKGDYAKAEPLYQRALAIREKALGPEHPDTATSLNNLAALYDSKGDYAKAEPLYQRALAIREKALGPEHPDTATSLNNLAALYDSKGDYTKAEPLYLRALAIFEKALGAEHPDTAASLDNLAALYDSKGDYTKAEPLYLRALAIIEKALGPEHPATATSLNNLAALYRSKGDYAKAEPLHQRALAIREKALGPQHPDTATSLNNLAELYRNKGDYAQAEPLYQRALAIREKALGPQHPDTATSLNNLAELYRNKGDYAQAEPLYQRALAIYEKALGPEHPATATSLNNLAGLYVSKGDYTKAEPLHQRALAIREKALGPEHPATATSLNNLALLYDSKGDYAKAEPLHQRALAIYEKALGPEHPATATSLNNLALLYDSKGDYAKAEPLHQRALAIYEKALGPEYPDTATLLNNLAALYDRKGDVAQAIAFQSRASAIEERNIALNTRTGSERQKAAYLATLTGESEYTVSLHARSAPQNAAARDLALTVILQRKGRTLDVMTDTVSALRQRANPQDQALLDQLLGAQSQLARLVLGGPQRTTPAEHQAASKAAQEQVERLEAEISRRSAEFRALAQPVTIAAVQAAIPVDAALIEFFSYRPFNAKDNQWGERRYIAYVLRRQGEAQWADLGEGAEIDRAVAEWRKVLIPGEDKKLADTKPLAREVDRLVMQPLRPLLGKTRRVLLSPDGALNLVPFAALVDEANRYLVESYEFSYLTSGRDLLRLQVKQENRQTAMIVADPDFGEEAKDGKARERGLKLQYGAGARAETGEGTLLAGAYFPPLPGTAEEAKALKAIVTDATVLTRAQATEAALKQANRPRILHIATHGFFLDNPPPPAGESQGRKLLQVMNNREPPVGRIDNPLLRSGLAFAGANLGKGNNNDDGILTAQEAAGLNLWSTKMVVLSACETGVGEVKTGEGVYGLRRALVLAGAETQVMSLWPVSDKGTRDLMIEYYRALQKGGGRSAGLRAVQLRLLKRPERAHPYYWASFIQSGEWANLDGKR